MARQLDRQEWNSRRLKKKLVVCVWGGRVMLVNKCKQMITRAQTHANKRKHTQTQQRTDTNWHHHQQQQEQSSCVKNPNIHDTTLYWHLQTCENFTSIHYLALRACLKLNFIWTIKIKLRMVWNLEQGDKNEVPNEIWTNNCASVMS